jgi:hypothetical protein
MFDLTHERTHAPPPSSMGIDNASNGSQSARRQPVRPRASCASPSPTPRCFEPEPARSHVPVPAARVQAPAGVHSSLTTATNTVDAASGNNLHHPGHSSTCRSESGACCAFLWGAAILIFLTASMQRRHNTRYPRFFYRIRQGQASSTRI